MSPKNEKEEAYVNFMAGTPGYTSNPLNKLARIPQKKPTTRKAAESDEAPILDYEDPPEPEE